jgi:hypothetical protein
MRRMAEQSVTQTRDDVSAHPGEEELERLRKGRGLGGMTGFGPVEPEPN